MAIGKNYAVILAAGRGIRMGGDLPKQFLPLLGKPVLAHALQAFDGAPSIDGVVLTAEKSNVAYLKEEFLQKYPTTKPVIVIEGGEDRQQSVYNALTIAIRDADIVAIHDGVRPMITIEVIEACIAAAITFGASVAGMPVKDTIKQVSTEGFVLHTPERSTLWQVQTPQTFRYNLILEAHCQAIAKGFRATDDSALVERLGRSVKMVDGGYDNIKITTQEDLLSASLLLQARGR